MFWTLFFVFLMACIAAGATGSLFPPGTWYEAMKKPSWTPPNWLFPVAWFILYGCMAFAGARSAMEPDNGLAMALWALQIALNGLWTPAFFGLRNIRLGMLVVSLLWLSVAATCIALWQLDAISGLLFVPYLLWVTIAAALNWQVWRLNPEAAQSADATD